MMMDELLLFVSSPSSDYYYVTIPSHYARITLLFTRYVQ